MAGAGCPRHGSSTDESVELLTNINSSIRNLSESYDLLGSINIDEEDTLLWVQHIYEEAEQQDTTSRLARWNYNMQYNDPATRRWIKGADPGVVRRDGICHPQHRAEAFFNKLCTLWRANKPLRGHDCIQAMLGPERGHAPCPQVIITGDMLHKRVFKMDMSSAGPDMWLVAQLRVLPVQWWDLVAQLWTDILNEGGIPHPITQVRTVAIPKDDGTDRPISVASSIWRIVATAIFAQLRDWLDAWAPPEMVGGFASRCADDVHVRLAEDLEEAQREEDNFVAGKIDAAKCYGNVEVEQAIYIWELLGCDVRVCNLLREFYNKQERWVEVEGCIHWEPIAPRFSLLQGCPFSNALLAGEMLVWKRCLERQARLWMCQ